MDILASPVKIGKSGNTGSTAALSDGRHASCFTDQGHPGPPAAVFAAPAGFPLPRSSNFLPGHENTCLFDPEWDQRERRRGLASPGLGESLGRKDERALERSAVFTQGRGGGARWRRGEAAQRELD